jgi:hypothetical protein
MINKHLTNNRDKKRTFVYLLLTIIFLTMLTACSAKSTITGNEFSIKLKELGFEVLDDSEQCRANNPIKTCLYVETGSIYVGFIVFDSSNQAVSGFNRLQEQAESYNNVSFHTTSINAANYNKFSTTSGGVYFYIMRIDDTLFYGSCDEAEKKILDTIVKTIKYK